ncbi:MAG TPA: hypothetical protein VFX11_07750 [Candidatus Kapabacteria bacterium]|nr:hypothetical protein [Candidatus Kapabacteria bacterium]
MRSLKQNLKSATLALAMAAFAGAPALSNAEIVTERPTGLEMTANAVLVRPLTLVATVVGTVVYVVSLPFSALGGNAGEAGQTLVVTPFKATFVRCLGCTEKHLAYAERQE